MAGHWQLIETTCRAIAGHNWLRTASRALGVPQADLRATFDRDDLLDEAINRMLTQLKRAVAKYEAGIKARALRISTAAMDVQIAQDDRMVELMKAEEDRAAADPDCKLNRVTAAFLADLLIEEAA